MHSAPAVDTRWSLRTWPAREELGYLLFKVRSSATLMAAGFTAPKGKRAGVGGQRTNRVGLVNRACRVHVVDTGIVASLQEEGHSDTGGRVGGLQGLTPSAPDAAGRDCTLRRSRRGQRAETEAGRWGWE